MISHSLKFPKIYITIINGRYLSTTFCKGLGHGVGLLCLLYNHQFFIPSYGYHFIKFEDLSFGRTEAVIGSEVGVAGGGLPVILSSSSRLRKGFSSQQSVKSEVVSAVRKKEKRKRFKLKDLLCSPFYSSFREDCFKFRTRNQTFPKRIKEGRREECISEQRTIVNVCHIIYIIINCNHFDSLSILIVPHWLLVTRWEYFGDRSAD